MIRRGLALALAAVAASCAPLPPPGPAPAPELVQARRAALRALTHWDLRGRVAVRLPEDGAQASLRWLYRADGAAVDLTGPFGGGHARLRYDANGAHLRDAQGREYEGADPETLLFRVTGWYVPLGGLVYWIRGLPAPDVAGAEQLDEHGRLRALKQLGWDIEFLAYASVGDYELPSKLFLRRALPARAGVADDPRIEVRLVVNSWDIGK